LPLIVCLKLGTFVQGNRPKNGGKCTHGGILSGVFLNAGVRPRNDTIYSNITSMEACIDKCCKMRRCDLAMKIGQVCHAVSCQDDDSCQISHRRKGSKIRAEIAFITKGEEVKSEPKTKPTKTTTTTSTTSKSSTSPNTHQSTVNKKPTIPLNPKVPRINIKAVNSQTMLQQSSVEKQKPKNIIDPANNFDSGSGSGDGSSEEEVQEDAQTRDETDKEDDESGDSGSSIITSSESSGSTGNPDREGLNLMDDDSYVLPKVVRLNSKLPSASRSAIPTPLEQLGASLGLPLTSYSHEDSSYDGKEEDGQNSVSFDDDEDDDDGDNAADQGKGRTELVSNRNAEVKGPSQRKWATTKSSIHKPANSHVMPGFQNMVKVTNQLVRANDRNRFSKLSSKSTNFRDDQKSSVGNKGNELPTVFQTATHDTRTNTNRGHMQSTEHHLKSGIGKLQSSYWSMEANRAATARKDTSEKAKQLYNRSRERDAKRTGELRDSVNNRKKDFNDMTRAVISKVGSNSNDKSNGGEVVQQMKSKKAGVPSISKQNEKPSYPETRLQKELSTLFAKDTTKINRNSFINPSKKSSFENIQKLQEQRDRKRHHSNGHSSLYQILHVPRESAKCRRGVTIRGATLRGGILAGDFQTVGIVDNQHTCVSSCCKNKRCDVALMLGKECFNVKCYSSNLCGLAPAAAIFDEVTPIITYVRGHVQKRSADDVDEEIIEDQNDGHTQLLKWLKMFI